MGHQVVNDMYLIIVGMCCGVPITVLAAMVYFFIYMFKNPVIR